MGDEREKRQENAGVRVILLIFSIIVFFILCYFLRGTLISLFLAFIVAYIFNPVVNFFERKHIYRGFGIAILIITVLLSTAGFLTYAIPKTVAGIYQVGTRIKEQYPKYQPTIDGWIEKYGDMELFQSLKMLLKDHIEPARSHNQEEIKAADALPEKGTVAGADGNQKLMPSEESLAQTQTLLQKKHLAEAVWGFKKYLPQVGSFSLNIINNIFYGAFGIFGVIINFIIFGVVSVYLLRDFNTIAQHIKNIFPLSKREQAMRLLLKINDNLRYFLQGQLIICLILSLIYSIGLTIAGIPLSFLIGFIGGFGNLIPYVGTGTGIVLAFMLSLFQFHDFKHILYVFITFGVGQLLEGMVITPRVMGKGLGLSPVMVILSILICSQLLGFLGLLLAVPIASTVKVFVDEIISRYKSSPYYKG